MLTGVDTSFFFALIVSSFLQAECEEIYTKDAHLGLYKKKGVKVIYLNK